MTTAKVSPKKTKKAKDILLFASPNNSSDMRWFTNFSCGDAFLAFTARGKKIAAITLLEIVRFRQKPQGVDAVATPKPQKRGAVLRPVALPHLGRLLFGETEFLHQKAVHPIVQGDEKAARRTKNRIVEIDAPKLHGGALRRDRHPSFFAAEKYRHTHSFRKKEKTRQNNASSSRAFFCRVSVDAREKLSPRTSSV